MNKLPTLSIIGGGRVGKTLGKLFVQKKVATLEYVINQTLSSAEAACRFIGAGTPTHDIQSINSDIILISVRDDAISSIVESIPAVTKDRIILHCSGAFGKEILLGARTSATSVAAVHPIKTFANPESAVKSFAQTPCIIDSDEDVKRSVTNLFLSIGGIPIHSSIQDRTLYHGGLVLACQNLVALAEASHDALIGSGLSQNETQLILQSLMNETLNNYFQLGTLSALTGPVIRGDLNTIAAHKNALEKIDAEHLYTSLTDFIRRKISL